MTIQRHNPAYRLAHLQKTKLSAETRGAVFQLQKRILLKEPVRKKCALRRREEDSEMSKIEKTKGVLAAAALTVFSLAGSSQVFAMDAPGSGDPDGSTGRIITGITRGKMVLFIQVGFPLRMNGTGLIPREGWRRAVFTESTGNGIIFSATDIWHGISIWICRI